MNSKLKATVALILAIIFGAAAGWAVDVNIRPTTTEEIVNVEDNSELVLSEEQVPALIEDENGEIVEKYLPTVDEVDGDQLLDEDALNELNLGRGAYYDVSSPEAFEKAVIGKCIDMDSKYGAQCVDLFNAFSKSYSNRWMSTCGTGAARGLWNCKEQNAGGDFELITDKTKLQAGDWVILDGGVYGHVGMAKGPYNNGYVALLGENQGGKSCNGGGAAGNIINMNLNTFKGAFRPKAYIKVEPVPEPTPAPITTTTDACKEWTLKKGDTLGKIMRACRGKVTWGATMNEYAKQWVDKATGVVVFDGWSTWPGIGLYAGHTIVYKGGE